MPGCSYKRENSSRRGLHELPKNEAVRRKILKDLGFPDDFVISCKQFHICSAHFSDDSFTWKGKKSLIAEPTVDNTKLMQVKQEEEDGRIILASQIKSVIEENSENEFVYQPTNFLEGELKKIKIRSYCQFCLNEQHELCSKIHVNEDLKQNFLDLTGKMVRKSFSVKIDLIKVFVSSLTHQRSAILFAAIRASNSFSMPLNIAKVY